MKRFERLRPTLDQNGRIVTALPANRPLSGWAGRSSSHVRGERTPVPTCFPCGTPCAEPLPPYSARPLRLSAEGPRISYVDSSGPSP
jgi:hypothetical protein